jgi:3-hydroxyisobutyrate dehydrogenase
MSRIGFLGLGAMGQRMALRLVAAGHTVTVWNRSPAATEALAAAGAIVAPTPRAAAEAAEVVISMLTDDPASRQVWTDPQHGAMAGMPRHAVAIECSTVTPGWIGELGAVAAARGLSVLDAPVAGSRPQAEAGLLIFMVGGDAAVVDRVEPVLLAMGSAVHRMGALGNGARLKLAVNTLFATQVVAIAEQLAALQAGGVDAPSALAVLKQMPVMSPAAAGAGAGILARAFAPMFPVDLVSKDLAYAASSAAADGLSLPLVLAVQARLKDAQQAGLGGQNLTSVAQLYG